VALQLGTHILAETADQNMPAEEVVAWTLEQFGERQMVITTSFGMEGCALIDMYARHGRPLVVVYVDTRFFFPETYALRDRLLARYPHIRFENRGTSLAAEAQAAIYGDELWKRNPALCCKLRKVIPMRKVLAEVDVWVTGLGRGQSASRAGAKLVAWNEQYQVLKVCPLVNWERVDVWEYVQRRDVPYNELHERGYPSIGCTHCTVPVPGCTPDDYSRAGRWPGSDMTECGLHTD